MGFHSLQIGKSALIAANYGLQVTGQNISNVNTTGYSRQVLNQSGAANSAAGGTLLGSGVSVKSVTRVADNYAEKQLRQATSENSYYCDLATCYSNLQSFFNELSGTALSDGMNSFRDSLSDLSAHVETLSNRTTVLQTAEELADRFNSIDQQLLDYRQNVNSEVEDSVAQINSLIATVAQLNRSIVTSESGGLSDSTANDLRDQRSDALRQLSELIEVEVTEEKNGSCIVSVNGRSLVYFDQVYDIGVEYQKSGDMQVAVPVFSQDGYPLYASGGSIAAQIEIRDVVIKGYQDELDELAASFTWEFNRIYSQTRGTEAYDSLTSLYSPVDPSVTLDQLEFKANTVDGTFQIENGNLTLAVLNKNTGQETSVNIEIDLDGRNSPSGEPDMILWDPANPDASNSFVNRLQSALDQAVPGAFKVSIDNEYKVTIESLSDDYGFSFESDTSGILAALGMNVLFTGHDASDIGVNGSLYDNPQHFGVSTSFETGDNTGLLSTLSFFDQGQERLGGLTVQGHYESMMGRLGGEAARVDTQKAVSADILVRMFNQRESVSGVNEDEEALNLIAYQRAYQSAAKFITVVDELYETLLNM